MTNIPLNELLTDWPPGGHSQPWTWDDEEADILTRQCICCGNAGHYQEQLEEHLRRYGFSDRTGGVVLGDDGRVGDGHHRIVAARRLGIQMIPVESSVEAGRRWLRDHGPVDWHDRKSGDRSTWEEKWRRQYWAMTP